MKKPKLLDLGVFGFLAVSSVGMLTSSREAQAIGFRVIGGGGYESRTLEGKGEEKDYSYSGFGLGVVGQAEVLEPVPGTGLIAGAGLNWNSVSHKEDGIEATLKFVSLGLEGGIEFTALPLITLQGVLGYDFGVSGTAESKLTNPDMKVTFDLDSSSDFKIAGRAFFSIAPMISLGIEPSWHMLTFTVKDKTIDGVVRKSEEVKGNGFSIRALVSIAI